MSGFSQIFNLQARGTTLQKFAGLVFSGTHHLLQGTLCDIVTLHCKTCVNNKGRKGKQLMTVPIHSEVTAFLHPYFPTTTSKPVSSPR